MQNSHFARANLPPCNRPALHQDFQYWGTYVFLDHVLLNCCLAGQVKSIDHMMLNP